MSRCRVCREVYTKRTSTQAVCSIACATKIAIRSSEKRKKADALKDRKQTRERLAKLKPRSDYLKEAQYEANRYVKLRDAHLPCVSCGTREAPAWHASHFRSVGSSPALRYEESNIHRSCIKCNVFLHGNLIPYRVELLKRVGEAEVARLEGPQPVMKWTIPELQEIKRTYKARADQLQKEKE